MLEENRRLKREAAAAAAELESVRRLGREQAEALAQARGVPSTARAARVRGASPGMHAPDTPGGSPARVQHISDANHGMRAASCRPWVIMVHGLPGHAGCQGSAGAGPLPRPRSRSRRPLVRCLPWLALSLPESCSLVPCWCQDCGSLIAMRSTAAGRMRRISDKQLYNMHAGSS